MKNIVHKINAMDRDLMRTRIGMPAQLYNYISQNLHVKLFWALCDEDNELYNYTKEKVYEKYEKYKSSF